MACSAAALLWAARLSEMTMSPGLRVGKMRRSMGASITNGAVRASQRRPAMKVWVFQCPNGALERSLRPLGQRPRKLGQRG